MVVMMLELALNVPAKSCDTIALVSTPCTQGTHTQAYVSEKPKSRKPIKVPRVPNRTTGFLPTLSLIHPQKGFVRLWLARKEVVMRPR